MQSKISLPLLFSSFSVNIVIYHVFSKTDTATNLYDYWKILIKAICSQFYDAEMLFKQNKQQKNLSKVSMFCFTINKFTIGIHETTDFQLLL